MLRDYRKTPEAGCRAVWKGWSSADPPPPHILSAEISKGIGLYLPKILTKNLKSNSTDKKVCI
jgi:hypothetical protein